MPVNSEQKRTKKNSPHSAYIDTDANWTKRQKTVTYYDLY